MKQNHLFCRITVESEHVTHSFSYLQACKCHVFRIAIKPRNTILVTLDCSIAANVIFLYSECKTGAIVSVDVQSFRTHISDLMWSHLMVPNYIGRHASVVLVDIYML